MKIAISQLEFIDHKLREIALAIESVFGEQTITSIYRIDDPGVHGTLPCRGIDLRDSDNAKEIQAWVNAIWEYDLKRPGIGCALRHKNRGSSGKHLHLQVHPNTRKKVN